MCLADIDSLLSCALDNANAGRCKSFICDERQSGDSAKVVEDVNPRLLAALLCEEAASESS
ncbi:Uncharacterised protein [Mycobacteroides abscessus subsp. abscessus]|nr:Uncharacterised protein [Mycobacteroides abscessus subsp. abscessus]